MIKTILDKLVDRFLGWKLPDTFGPDCYISFDRDTANKNNGWPVGTNLLTAIEAKEMLKYISSGIPVLSDYLNSNDSFLYTYNAKLIKIVDGDTLDVIVDLGFDVFKKIRCRLANINAPEMNTDAGKASKQYLVNLIPVNSDIVIKSKKYDKYGRSVATIYFNDININDLMLHEGYAIPYVE